jgi:uncharacterized RDD family membrane protein YckC
MEPNGPANSPLNTEAVSSRLDPCHVDARCARALQQMETFGIDRARPEHTRRVAATRPPSGHRRGASTGCTRAAVGSALRLDAPGGAASHAFMDPSLSNPYQAPAAGEPLERQAAAPGEAATRGSRLAAYVMDSLITFAVMFPLQLWGGVFKGFPGGMKTLEFPKSLLWSIAWILLWIALNGTFLAKSAQTIVKKLMGLQIVMVHDGKPASFERLIFWRFLPVMLLSQVPYVGAVVSLADMLFIFRPDRRCLHDHIAGTRVVELDKN